MKTSTKAVLLSALVIPGAGHYYLRKPLAGTILCGISIIVIGYIVSEIFQQAVKLIANLESGGIPLDVPQLTALVALQTSKMDTGSLSIATTVFALCWVIGIIDSYRLGISGDTILNS